LVQFWQNDSVFTKNFHFFIKLRFLFMLIIYQFLYVILGLKQLFKYIMLLTLHPDNPQPRLIEQAVAVLKKGGVIIYPTDTIYGLGCDITVHKAIERICVIKNINPAKAQLSFICRDLSHLSDYAKSISTPTYRLLKSHLPGPYTFILPASKQVPRILESKKATIGLRIPNNKIAMAIVAALGNPLLSTSLPGDMVEDYTDPEIINDKLGHLVDYVLDGGIGGMQPSTIVDCTGADPVLIRAGKGDWE
jgi:tRNA threonylcarbamoyl adenosine modification protein (Sua5/YciO/YrdC/YwlC family)